ncbi:MAG TPA: DUF5132 domain-containing protein [Chloroflexota bacterium]|nr:DUF5132 domain-containing protein [Chloroflexota bacterium]
MGSLMGVLARGVGMIFGAGAVKDASTRLSEEARPAVRAAVRAGLVAGDRLGALTAGAREQLEDLVAEARAELRQGKGPEGPQ